MRYNLFTSDTYQDSLQLLLEKFKQQYKSDSGVNYIVVVPDRVTMSVEKKVFDALDIEGAFNIQVLSFSSLSKIILEQEKQTQKPVLNKQSSIALIKKIILDNKNNLKTFSKTANNTGFAKQMLDTINKLKKSDVDYEQLKNSYKGNNKSLAYKLSDISLIYKKYQEITKQNYSELYNRIQLVNNISKDSKYIQNSRFYLGLFDSFSKQEYKLIENLVKFSQGVFVSYPYNNENPQLFLEDLDNNLKAIAKKNSMPIAQIKDSKKSNFDNLRKNIFDNLERQSEDKIMLTNRQAKKLQFFESNDIEQEVEFTAIKIKKHIIYDKLRFKNINIAVPDIEKYKTYIKKVFNRYKIPYFIDSSLNLVDHPLSKFVLDGMECLRTNFQRESVFSYLNNYFSGLEQEEYNNFENIVLKYNIYGNKFFENIKDFLSTFNDIEQKDIDSFIKVVEEKLMPLYRMGSGTDTQQPLKFYIQNINEFLEQMEYRKYIEKLIEEYRADNDFINEKLSAQILDKFTQALEDLNVILGENVFNLTDFISILETVLNSITVSVIPVDLDSVFVGDIKNNNFEVCSAMFILGAVEGVVPQQYTDSALFMDEEINQLNTKDKISPTMDELNARSKFNLFQLMFISNKFLTFSYPTIYESEINTNLSLIIDNLRKIFILSDNKNLPKIKFSDLFVNKETNIDLTALYYNNNEVGLNRYINSIRNIEDNNELKNLESVSALEKILIESYGQERINYYKKLLDYKKEYPKIKNAKDLFFPKNTISASQLKSYFQCPFQHFIQYGLRLQEKEVADLKPKDVGNILHEVANEFGLYLKSNNKRYLSEESLERVQEYIIQKIFNKDKYQYILNDITFRRITKNLKIEARDLIAAINYQLKYMDFTIDKTEYSLDKENIENIYFEIGNDEKVWLKGYIDRIDVSDKYYTIIDYKSGNVEFNFDKIYTGLNLQLLLYAKAVDKAVDKKLAGFFYLPIKQDYDDKQEVALNYKGYKFLGGFLKKLDAIYSLDNRLKQEDYLKSDIIRFTYKKNADKTDKTIDKDFNKRETGAILGEEQMKNLQNYAWKVSQKAIKEMEDGNIDARPVMQSGKISCDFCKFNSICMYYDKLQDNSRDFTNAVDDEQKEKVKSIITDQSWED